MSKRPSDATDSVVQKFTTAVEADRRATEDILERTRDIGAAVNVMTAVLRRIERGIDRILTRLERGDDA